MRQTVFRIIGNRHGIGCRYVTMTGVVRVGGFVAFVAMGRRAFGDLHAASSRRNRTVAGHRMRHLPSINVCRLKLHFFADLHNSKERKKYINISLL